MAEENKNLQKPSFLSPERYFDVGFTDVELGKDDNNTTKVNVDAETGLLGPVMPNSQPDVIVLPSGKTITVDMDLISGKLNPFMIPGPKKQSAPTVTGAPTTTTPPAGIVSPTSGTATPTPPIGGGMTLVEIRLRQQILDLEKKLTDITKQLSQNIIDGNSELSNAVTNLIQSQSQTFSEDLEITNSNQKYFFDLRLSQAANPPTWL